MSHVEPWAAQRLTTLAAGVGQPVRALDFSDDRLGAILDALSEDEQWESCEQALNAQTLRVYDLQPQRARLDSTTVKSYGTVTPEGLLQLGHSKDHRPDLPPVKINLSVLDPLGLPLTATVVSGERADDPLYVPEIQRVQASVGRRGVTYVGDCKMAALQTRAMVAASGDYYLGPLSSTQLPATELAAVLAAVWHGEQQLRPISRPADQLRPQPPLIAEGLRPELVGGPGTAPQPLLPVPDRCQHRRAARSLAAGCWTGDPGSSRRSGNMARFCAAAVLQSPT